MIDFALVFDYVLVTKDEGPVFGSIHTSDRPPNLLNVTFPLSLWYSLRQTKNSIFICLRLTYDRERLIVNMVGIKYYRSSLLDRGASLDALLQMTAQEHIKVITLDSVKFKIR